MVVMVFSEKRTYWGPRLQMEQLLIGKKRPNGTRLLMLQWMVMAKRLADPGYVVGRWLPPRRWWRNTIAPTRSIGIGARIVERESRPISTIDRATRRTRNWGRLSVLTMRSGSRRSKRTI
jgi:hypothetical protein